MWPQVWLHCGMAESMEMYKYRERPSRMRLVQAIAKHRGDNVSEVIRDALKAYARAHQHELPDNGLAASAIISAEHVISRELAEDMHPQLLDQIEADVRARVAKGLAQRGMTLAAEAEVEWRQQPASDEGNPQSAPTRWVRGEPLAEDTKRLTCRLSGAAVPVTNQDVG